MKKYIKFLFIITFSLISFISHVYSKELIKEEVDNVYIFRKGGNLPAFSGPFTNYEIDGKTTYCIEPGMHITTNEYITYQNNDINKRIQLIGYYGYDYPNHQTLKYKMATQALIWEEISNQITEYWTKPSGAGSIINISKEREDILNLVNNHIEGLEFDSLEKEGQIGTAITFIDNLNNLNNYEIDSSNQFSYEISSNKLIITPNMVGNIKITLKRKSYTKDITTYYIGINNTSQKMAFFGANTNDYITINIKVNGGKVNIIKKDKDTLSTIPQGDASLNGAIYGIYDLDDRLITKVTTNGDVSTSDILPNIGKYYLKEITPSKGYTKDETKYYFEINSDNINPTVTVYEKAIYNNYKFYKVINSKVSGILESEPNITFDIILKRTNEIYSTHTTDQNGFFEVLLPYGTYIIKQKNTLPGLTMIDPFEVNISKDQLTITKVIANNQVKPRLRLIKIDNMGDTIHLDGIKFKIKNIDTNEYICQNINYPNNKTICEYETLNGVFITPEGLDYGNYQIEEIKQNIKGFLWNDKPVTFKIDETTTIYDNYLGPIIEVRFMNERIYGEVNIYKMGEKIVIKDNKIEYEDIKLDNTSFNLYAKNDIYFNNKLIHKKDELIKTFIITDGYYKLDNLYLGSYYLKEINTSDNYNILKENITFDIEYLDSIKNVSIDLIIKNYLKKGGIEITKLDLSTSEPIEGVTFSIYDINNNLIYQNTTDSNGKIFLNNLPIGKYYFKETNAKDNYLLNEESHYFEINEDEQIIESTITNEKIKVPITDSYKNYYLSIIAIINIFLGNNWLHKYVKKD